MAGVDPQLVRRAPRSTEDLLELLFDGLDWPRPGDLDIEDIPLLPWTPDELHLDPQAVARLDRIQQLPKLTADQPFGVFILTFEGERLPVGAIRRVVNQLVRKQRARRQQAQALWDLEDLIFFCQAGTNHHALHVVAFRDTDRRPVMKVISWNTASTEDRIRLVGDTNLPALTWPEADTKVEQWRQRWTAGFTAGYRQAIRSADTLATQMAEVATNVRDEVTALYEVETADGPLRMLYAELKTNLREDLTPSGFADMYAQTMVYGLLTARITNPDGFSADALDDALKFDNPLLDALYASFRQQANAAIDVDEFGLHDLAEVLAQVDIDQVLADFGANNRKDDPVVFFYEEFLERYDPSQRRELGTYYTPGPVVRCIVRAIDDTLKALGLPDGVADQTSWADYQTRTGTPIPTGANPDEPVVRAIDPATGTGTFLIEWLRQATDNLDGRTDASIEDVVAQLDAFEISLSSYAVAHLKATLELPPEVRTHQPTNILLADTLAGPRPLQIAAFGEDPVAAEGQRAQHLKYDTPHTVVFGNPPYDKVEQEGSGGWITSPNDDSKALFADILDPARQHTIFSHHSSLYNLYVYFWRWAIWKAFEQSPSGPAVVAYITASSWLTGPGFLGLRQLIRELADDIYVIDLGGDNLGARKDENVFPIQSPVAITLLVRRDQTDRTQPATVHYHRINGTRSEKLATLGQFRLDQAGWQEGPNGWHKPLAPVTGAADWADYPQLSDLLPWQQPGCMFSRTWPIAPHPALLEQRWDRFVATNDPDDRAACYITPRSGRSIHTKVGDLPRLVDLPIGAAHAPIRGYGYRSFDRQWAFNDPRLAKTDSPSLWASHSTRQAFMASFITKKLGSGPAATVTTYVPDKDYFCGRGGKDVIPLFRDADGTPNADPALLALYGETLGLSCSVAVEDLFAYVYGVLAGADYTDRFAEELETPGPRVPLTSDTDLFTHMAEHGRRLLWLHTYGERFGDGQPERLEVPDRIRWNRPVTVLPDTPRDNRYNPDTQILHVGDGDLVGVREVVWNFEVSGMQVVKKWLGYRTRAGTGRSASSRSPLDQIRPDHWYNEWSDELRELVYVLDATIEAAPHGTDLLDQICTGPLIGADELPPVPEVHRKVPRTPKASPGQMNLA